MNAGEALAVLERRRPQALTLATWLSPAVRIERELIRVMRMTALPGSHAEVEADLWFSGLAEAAGVDGIVLRADVAEILRARLAALPESAYRARSVIRGAHAARIPPALELEEELVWLAMTDAPDDAIDATLSRVLRALMDHDRDDLLDWAVQALDRLPARVTDTPSGQVLRAAVTRRPMPLPVGAATQPRLLSALPRVRLALRLSGSTLLLGEIPADAPDAVEIEVPDTTPRVLEILAAGLGIADAQVVAVPEGALVDVVVGEGPFELRTASGDVYGLAGRDAGAEAVESDADAAREQGYLLDAPLPDSVRLPVPWEDGFDRDPVSALNAPSVGWAVAYVIRWQLVHAGFLGPDEPLSARFISMAAKEREGERPYPSTFLDAEEPTLAAALRVARRFGVALERQLPWRGPLAGGSPSEFYAVAARHRLVASFSLGDGAAAAEGGFTDWRAWLHQRGPMLVRIAVDATARSGQPLAEPFIPSAHSRECAAVLMGYQSDGFVVRAPALGEVGASLGYLRDAVGESYGVVAGGGPPASGRETADVAVHAAR